MGAVAPMFSILSSVAGLGMTMFGGGGQVQAPPPIPAPIAPPAPVASAEENPDAQKAAEDLRKRNLQAYGMEDTNMTGSLLIDEPKTEATLLGGY